MEVRKQATFTVNVSRCPRCGGEHEGLLLQPVENPVEGFDLWGFCMEKNQPVLTNEAALKPPSAEDIHREQEETRRRAQERRERRKDYPPLLDQGDQGEQEQHGSS